VVEYRWDFDAPGGTFQSDLSTSTNSTVHTYTQTGNYIAMVNVTDSDGSSAETHVIIRIVNKPLVGAFGTDVTITRDQAATNIITFNASLLADKNKDIAETIWSFGDGTSLSYDGAPHAPVVHEYEPVKDYVVNLTVTDDDPESHSLTIKTTLLLKAPTINLRDLPTHSVVREGTPVDFIIAQGSTPLVSVTYSVRGGEFQEFAAFYTIDTSGWQDGLYDIVVRAEDAAGNVAMSSGIKVVIDTVDPSVTFLTQVSSVYGGDKFNISISVDDANVAPGEVVLYVKLPGDSTFSSYSMYPAGDGVYYRLIDVPTREGTIEYYANVTDLAGNYQVTGIHSATVRLHFLDAAWPFLLAIAVLASLGTGAYFMRETQIAVDETFVIYNDGRLISHSTRRLKPGMDDQVLSGMFAAIQDFVRDSFKDVTSFTLRKLEFGEKSVLIEKGSYLFLAVILHGKASKKVAMKMQRIVDEIEETFADALNEWDGDLDALRGVGDIAKKLYSKAPLLPWLMNRPEN
jgi:PKD repeat protein